MLNLLFATIAILAPLVLMEATAAHYRKRYRQARKIRRVLEWDGGDFWMGNAPRRDRP